jgi:AcrR family transcriptional regulator
MDKGHRESLRQAARELVREKGLARTTARDLVGVSGTNLRSIGYHFGSKDALMAEVLALISAEWTEAPVAASRADAGTALPEERMTSAVRTMLMDLAGKREDLLVYLEGVLEARHSAELAASLVQTQEAALDAIADSILAATPALPREIARVLARMLVAVHDGLALEAAVADAPDLHDVESLLLGLAGLGITLGAGLGIPGAADVLRSLLPAEPA